MVRSIRPGAWTWTRDGKVLHSYFQGLREDKQSEAIIREKELIGHG
jgi:hypothetical protein